MDGALRVCQCRITVSRNNQYSTSGFNHSMAFNPCIAKKKIVSIVSFASKSALPINSPSCSVNIFRDNLQSVIKPQLAPRLARPPAITADSKAMSPEIAPWKQRPKLATSAVKKAIFPGTALKQELPLKAEAEAEAAEASLEVPLDLNVTAAAKWGISLVRALNLLEVPAEAEAEVEAMVEVEVEVGMATLASRRLATLAVV